MTNQAKFLLGPSPHELRPLEVLRKVGEWNPKDWLYSEEEDVFCYRSNLLIKLERDHSKTQRVYNVIYGYQVVGQALIVSAAHSGVSHGTVGMAHEKVELKSAWQPNQDSLVAFASKVVG